ncbi:MAG: hypothetical protein AAB965_01045 [Patescibacteria group bacterium]
MKVVNDFVQKNSNKSEDEKKKILVASMVIGGIIIVSVGMIDISNNLASINTGSGEIEKKSSLAAIRDKFSEAINGIKEKMQTVNDEIGQAQK